MRFVAFSSKPWILMLLCFVGLFAGIIFLAWQSMPLIFQIVFPVMISAAAIACLAGLFRSSPLYVADEDGLSCYRAIYGLISWEDIEASIRIPRVEKYQCRGRTHYMWSFTDAWRPIDIYVRDLTKYSTVIPKRLHAILMRRRNPAIYPDCFRLRLDLTGSTGSSEDLQAVIQHYLNEKKKT